jgi:ComF family protein
MITIKEIRDSLVHLLFPDVCPGCGNEIFGNESLLCLQCINEMPETNFEKRAANPIEKKFWGRLPLRDAAALYYFTRESLMQRLMHELKYRGNEDLGFQLGVMMGKRVADSGRFYPDVLVPLPLFPSREKKRGYNQAAVLCEGMSEILRIPVLYNAVTRPMFTETQTKKGRIERWNNIEGKFVLERPTEIANRTIMLVDDVITTGATLESCGMEILKGENVSLSLLTLCYASRT